MNLKPETTPEFLVWTLAQPCALKQVDGWDQPERAERQLRAAREYGAAVREGRCRGEVCYDRAEEPQHSFRVAEALRVYGGPERVVAACTACPANALGECVPGSLAGCYGELPLPQPATEFYERVEQAINAVDLRAAVGRLFVPTSPSWFGLWMQPISGDRAVTLQQVLGADDLLPEPARSLLLAALATAAGGEIPLHAALYPRGTIEERRWKLAPYCVHCRAEIADYRRPCPTCRANRLTMPPLVRHVRGSRPWTRISQA